MKRNLRTADRLNFFEQNMETFAVRFLETLRAEQHFDADGVIKVCNFSFSLGLAKTSAM